MKISIVVTSYNHEKYIRQCIESILVQQGEFDREIILGDDRSTDCTPQILDEYEKKYPGLFVRMQGEKNLGITKNLQCCLAACTGDYIAICEGDDYWTDPWKLDRQVRLLEAQPDLSMCFNMFTIYYEKQGKYDPYTAPLDLNRDILTINDLLKLNYIGNFSCCMYRTSVVRQLPAALYSMFTVDWMFNMACSEMGDIGFINESMSIYRKHSGGAWAGKPEMKQLEELLDLITQYNHYFLYKYDREFMDFSKIVRNRIDEISGVLKPEPAIQSQVQSPVQPVHPPESEGATPSEKTVSPGLIGQAIKIFKDIFRPYWRKLIWIRNMNILHPNNVARFLYYGFLSFPQKMQELYAMYFKTADLVILDTIFPHPFSPFRLEEYKNYLDYFPNSIALSTCEQFQMLSEKRSPVTVIREFEKKYPKLRGKTIYSPFGVRFLRTRLAYTTFLYNTEFFLKTLERSKTPFVFTLYPGGGFELNQPRSNELLYRITQSPQFRKVIVTQKISYDYLISYQFCTPDQIEFIYGVVSSLSPLKELEDKEHFGFGKDTLDICFVAYKYTEKGADKGYDIFIETAKRLASKHDNIFFHVVGTFTETDIPIDHLEGKIFFYGAQQKEWLDRFYPGMDIILSPNVPFVLLKGSFDGFPTGSCTDAGYFKVAMFCTDELALNIAFVNREDIVIIPHDTEKIEFILEYYYAHPDELRMIAERGAAKIRDIYSYEKQMIPRIRVLEQEIAKEKARNRDNGSPRTDL